MSAGMILGGRYELRVRLGAGGAGTVWSAFDGTLRREVAIKLVSLDVVGPGDRDAPIARFRREAQAVAALNHPNVVAAYDFGLQDDMAYLVMELIVGVSLADHLRRLRDSGEDRFDESTVIRIAQQVCAGLAVAHRARLVHRDLKPSNLMLVESTRQVKIVDFGIARVAEQSRLTRTGSYLGTLPYVAPEQMDAEPIDGRADLYSFGCVLHELASGRSPYDAQTPMQWMVAHQYGKPAPLRSHVPGASERLETLLLRLLAKNPAYRPADADTVNEMLAEIAGAASPTGVVPMDSGGHVRSRLAAAGATVPVSAEPATSEPVVYGPLTSGLFGPPGGSAASSQFDPPIAPAASGPAGPASSSRPGLPVGWVPAGAPTVPAAPDQLSPPYRAAPVGQLSAPTVPAAPEQVSPPLRSLPAAQLSPVAAAPARFAPPATPVSAQPGTVVSGTQRPAVARPPTAPQPAPPRQRRRSGAPSAPAGRVAPTSPGAPPRTGSRPTRAPRRRRRTGRIWLAVVVTLVLAGGAVGTVVALTGSSHSKHPIATPTPTPPLVPVAGDCFVAGWATPSDGDGTTVWSASDRGVPVTCATPHSFEVVNVAQVDRAIAQAALPPLATSVAMRGIYNKCVTTVNAYLGGDWRGAYAWLGVALPNSTAWQRGQHWRACVLLPTSTWEGTLTTGTASLADGLRGSRPAALACFVSPAGTPTPCAAKHTDEVVGVYRAAAGDWPGEPAVHDLSHDQCAVMVAHYLGLATVKTWYNHKLGWSWWEPDQEQWELGNRSAVCTAHAYTTDLTITGSVKGIGNADPQD